MRLRTLKTGKIVFNNASSVIDCVIKNLSQTGAKLKGENLALCPRNFVLKIPNGPEYECEVVWVKSAEIGVRFLGVEKAP